MFQVARRTRWPGTNFVAHTGSITAHGHHHARGCAGSRLLRRQTRRCRQSRRSWRRRSIPVCGMSVDPRPPSTASPARARTISSAGPLPRAFRGRAGKIPGAEDGSRRPRRRPAPSTPVRCIRRCGRSALVPVRSAAWRWSPSRSRSTQAPDPELIDMTRRFWIALVLTLPVFVHRDGQPSRPDASGAAGVVELDFLRAVDAGGAVGGRAVLCARLALAGDAQSQHVHADRDGHRRGLALQRGRHAGAAIVSASVSRHAWHGRGVFRGRGRHHGSGVARAGAGIAGARAHLRRDPRAARARAENRAAHHRTGRRGRRDRCDRGRRPLAGASGREDSGRWRRHRRPLRGRRIHGDGRVDAGVEGRRRARDRRHRQPERRTGAARGKSRPRHHAGAHRRHGGHARSARARRSSASPIGSPAGSCRR